MKLNVIRLGIPQAGLGDFFLQTAQKFQKFGLGKGSKGMVLQQNLRTVPEGLQIILFTAGKPDADVFKVCPGMQSFDCGGAELVVSGTAF